LARPATLQQGFNWLNNQLWIEMSLRQLAREALAKVSQG
jgi:hypothetical protein